MRERDGNHQINIHSWKMNNNDAMSIRWNWKWAFKQNQRNRDLQQEWFFSKLMAIKEKYQTTLYCIRNWFWFLFLATGEVLSVHIAALYDFLSLHLRRIETAIIMVLMFCSNEHYCFTCVLVVCNFIMLLLFVSFDWCL